MQTTAKGVLGFTVWIWFQSNARHAIPKMDFG
jgi:hypothetical protein